MLDRIIRFLHAKNKPCYIGEVAIEIVRSIELTEAALNRLVNTGEVRWLSLDESVRLGADLDAMIICLVGKAKADKAYE